MAYVKVGLKSEQVSDFMQYLSIKGQTVRPASAAWELGQVMIFGRFQAISVNGKGQVSVPSEMAGHVAMFMAELLKPEDTSDTQRLEFILGGNRKVIKEITSQNDEGGYHFKVYVAEGSWEEYRYPCVRYTGKSLNWGIGEGLEIQRQAIDLAIEQSKEQTSEKNN